MMRNFETYSAKLTMIAEKMYPEKWGIMIGLNEYAAKRGNKAYAVAIIAPFDGRSVYHDVAHFATEQEARNYGNKLHTFRQAEGSLPGWMNATKLVPVK